MPGSTLFLGPMYSGKTTEVIKELTRHRLGGCNCVLVKSERDTRYTAEAPIVRTHSMQTALSEPATEQMGGLRVVVAARLADVELEGGEVVVGVDEGQFFDDLREGLLRWVDRTVFVAALDGTHRREMFAAVVRALPVAGSFVKLHAVCTSCPGRDPVAAPYTRRVVDVDAEGEIAVGGPEMYQAVCAACYARGV